ASAAIRQHSGTRLDGKGLTGTIYGAYPATDSIFYQQVTDKGFFKEHNRGAPGQLGHQRSFNFCPRSIAASMQDAPATMGSFAAKQQSVSRSMSVAARLSPVKLHTHLHEPSHGSRGLLNQDAYGFAVA